MSKGTVDLSTALELSLSSDPAVEAKFEALKNLQALKTKSLMTSIDGLTKEVTRLKVLGKDSRRAQMVQALRNKMREYDLVVDVLKEELVKTGGLDIDEVTDLILRKTTGGPKRFRPLTREELERKIVEMERKAKKDAAIIASSARSGSGGGEGGTSSSGKANKVKRDPSAPGGLTLNLKALSGSGQSDADTSAKLAMVTEEVKQLHLTVDIKEGSLQTLREEVSRLKQRNAELTAQNEMVTQKERRVEDQEAMFEDVSRRLEDSTRNLGSAREECLLIQEASDADVEMLQKELEQLHAQCEQLLKQNTVLLRQLGEKELGESLLSAGVQAAGSDGAALQGKVDELTEKLKRKSGESMDYRVQAEKLRVEMRDKNEQIRELKRTMAEMKKLRA